MQRTLLASLLCLGISAAQAAAPPAKDRTVIVISLDGFPAYMFQRSDLPAPTLRGLMARGSYASGMQPVNPSVTWPNHTTLVSGVTPAEHHVIVNREIESTGAWPPVRVNPDAEKSHMVHAETLYDAAHQAGLTTAQVDWVAINNAPTITWAFPEFLTSPLQQEMISKSALTADDLQGFRSKSIVFRDEIWTRAAAYLLREHKPNLLLFHLLTLDSVSHTYAPGTLAAYTAIGFLDRCIAQLMAAVQEAGMEKTTTIFVVSDHGFEKVPKQIMPGAVLSAAGLGSQDVFCISEGGSLMIYVDKAKASELLPKAQEAFEKAEGVTRVAASKDFAALGLPQPATDPQMPDLIAYAKPGYGFGSPKMSEGPAIKLLNAPIGSHGYLNTDPEMKAIFIAAGFGIRQGVALGEIRNLSVAPTIAKLLGVKLPAAREPTLESILEPNAQ